MYVNLRFYRIPKFPKNLKLSQVVLQQAGEINAFFFSFLRMIFCSRNTISASILSVHAMIELKVSRTQVLITFPASIFQLTDAKHFTHPYDTDSRTE